MISTIWGSEHIAARPCGTIQGKLLKELRYDSPPYSQRPKVSNVLQTKMISLRG